jgi:hypothetical protein
MRKSPSTRIPGASRFDPDRFLLGLAAGLLLAFTVVLDSPYSAIESV